MFPFNVARGMIGNYTGKVGGLPQYRKVARKQLQPRRKAVHMVQNAAALRRELKYARAEYEGAVVGTVLGSESDPTAGSLSAVSTGTGESNRIGRVIFVKSIYVKGHINIATLSLLGSIGYVRLWLILDKQTNGAQLNAEDVLSDPTSTNLDSDAMQNLKYSDRFSVVKQLCIPIVPTNTAGNGTANDSGSIDVPFQLYHKCNTKQEHKSTSSAITDVTTTSYHLIAIKSANLTSSTNLRYVSQMRFTD